MIFKIIDSFEKHIILNADKVIPLSDRFAKKLTQGQYVSYKKHVWDYEVIPSHVDMKRFNKCNLSDTGLKEKYNLKGKFVLIYIGSVGTWYMLGEMLDFFRVMKNLIPEAVFLIVSHTDKNIIRKELHKKNMEEKDIILTETLPDEIPSYLSLADAAIAFIKPVFSKEACSPIKIGEYLASGLPIIINSGIGDTEALVKDSGCGVVIYKFEDSEYKKAILDLKGLIAKDNLLKERCMNTAKKHLSLEVALIKYKRLYKYIFGAS